MKVEEAPVRLGMTVPDLAELWRVNPVRDGRPYPPGVVGDTLTLAQAWRPRAMPR